MMILKNKKAIYNLLINSVNHHISNEFKNIKEKIDLLTSKEDVLKTKSIGDLINGHLEFFQWIAIILEEIH